MRHIKAYTLNESATIAIIPLPRAEVPIVPIPGWSHCSLSLSLTHPYTLTQYSFLPYDSLCVCVYWNWAISQSVEHSRDTFLWAARTDLLTRRGAGTSSRGRRARVNHILNKLFICLFYVCVCVCLCFFTQRRSIFRPTVSFYRTRSLPPCCLSICARRDGFVGVLFYDHRPSHSLGR